MDDGQITNIQLKIVCVSAEMLKENKFNLIIKIKTECVVT